MQIYKYHSANLQPVSGVYGFDQDVRLHDTSDYFRDGLDFIFVTALSGLQDVTTNNDSNLYLTQQNKSENILYSNTPRAEYPKYWPTYLKLLNYDYFLVTNNTGVAAMSGIAALKDNRYFYEIEILDPTYCAIRHFDGSTLKYLTLNQSTSAYLSFQTRLVDVAGAEWDSQIFKYILDESNNYLSLFSSVVSGDSASNRVLANPSVVGYYQATLDKRLIATDISKSWALEPTQVFEIRPVSFAPTKLSFQTTWNSYVSAIEENTLDVNTSKSIQSIENNYLLHSATNSVSSNMEINIIPLKNQLTVEGNQSRNNPYYTSEDEISHRDYHSLHTGTHEEFGDNDISIGFTSGSVGLNLPSNKLTYFNLPPLLTPYDKLNVNDAKFPQAGAIWADTPILADKIFKKLVNRNESVISDVIDGSLLCSWLSGNSDLTADPVWVDRFYNPHFVTKTTALTGGVLHNVDITGKFYSITDKLSAQNVYVYDKKSDLIFEPNALYSYYHIGSNDNEKHIESLAENLIAENVTKYVDRIGATVTPTYESISYETHTMNDSAIMSQSVHDDSSTTLQPTYTFESNNYAISDVSNFDGSFSLSFWMYNKDWTVPFADQLIGAYVTQGFGIFNEPYVTPFITAIDGDKIHLYNSEFKYISTHYNGISATCFSRRGSTENYWIVDKSNNIYEYDMKGVVQNKITSSLLTAHIVTDIEITDSYIYLGLENTESYFKWDLGNQSASYIGEIVASSIWNKGVTSTQAASGMRLHAVSKGLSGSSNVILTTPDIALHQGSTVDNLGNPWVIQNNILYTYDTSISANIAGLSATSSQILEGVNCDRDGNIWLLYGSNKLAKLDTDRKSLFNISLSSTPLSSARYIDFVHEHTDAGYNSYAVIMNLSLSGAKAIYVSTDGIFKSATSILTGPLVTGEEAVTHFSTSLSSSSSNYRSWKTITGADHLRKNRLNSRPRIDAKLSLTNLYNSSTTTAAYSAYTLSFDLSAMKRGWHHFNVNLDAELGTYDMYVDAVKVDSHILPPAKFSYSNIITQPITIGVTPFYSNIILPEKLSQPDRYYAKNMKIQDIKMYNKPLSYFDIRSHYLLRSTIHDVNWQIPTGQRSYIDTVERVFKHRLPGRKSEMFNVIVTGLSATDEKMKDHIKSEILAELTRVTPLYSKLNNISWDSSVSTATTLPTVTSYNVLSGSSSASSTPVQQTITPTGGSQSSGY